MTFDFIKTINYWSDSAAYDLETGESLLELKRYPYALFFGHLALEKILKAMEFHYESRYPDEKKEFYKKCTEYFSRKKFAGIKDVYQWLSRKLKD